MRREQAARIGGLSVVDQYIFVDSRGNIIAQDIKNPDKAAGLVLSCGQNSRTLAKNKFQWLVFSRKNEPFFFIFPVGNCYLGVIKSKNADTATLTGSIVNFLKEI
jgi:hypothetical protein